MITDRIENLKSYPEFFPYKEFMLEFIEKVKNENLTEGKFELKGEELFALVQCYESRPKKEGKVESHKRYCDLQYIVEGREYIGWTIVDTKDASEDRTPEADILFYEDAKLYGNTLLEAGMFGFYLPSDGHMPCIAVENPEPVKKIVFKILAEKE